jgi:hypothetical protein
MEVHSPLMQLVRAVRVLDGVGIEPTAEGVLLAGHRGGPVVPWADVAQTLGADPPAAPAPRLRLGLLVELLRTVQELGPAAVEAVDRAARPLALPTTHPLHPGPGWVRGQVPGGVLDVGLGVSRLLPGQDGVLPLPPSVATAAELAVDDAWGRLHPLADRLSTFAIDRLEADTGGPAVLTGVGGCDALTLLTLDPVRAWLGADAAPRLPGPGPTAARAPVSAPRRDRVWIGPAAADRDYVHAVWLLTAPPQRGVLDPMTVTADGVSPAALQRLG